MRIRHLLTGLLAWSLAWPAWADQQLVIGVFAYRPKPAMQAMMQPLASYLESQMPDLRVSVEVMDQEELQVATVSRQVDLVFTNPAHFLVLRSMGSVTTVMATAVSIQDGIPVKSLGGTIITQASSTQVSRLSDIRGMRIGIPGVTFLGGYQTQRYEFATSGLPFPGTNTVVDLGSHDAVIRAVLSGEVDVGFVRTGMIERTSDNRGPVKPRLRVVNPQVLAGFPYAISTRLYPEWPMVALSHVDDGLVRRLTSRLLALEADHPAMQAAGLGGFSPPLDYLPVEVLARELRMPPYDVPEVLNWKDLWDRHYWTIVASLTAVGLLLMFTMLLAWGNRRLTGLLREQVEARRKLRVTASVFSSAREGIIITDPQARIIDVNPAFTQITGYSREEALGRNPRFLQAGPWPEGAVAAMWKQLEEEGAWEGELTNRRKNGEVYYQLGTITRVLNQEQKPLHYISVFTDVTRQKRDEERLRQQAYFDDLTGLPNRTRLNELVGHLLTRIRSGLTTASLAYIDLDGFKEINDRHGHHVGDQLLKALTHQLHHVLGPEDTLARLGGDEFVVLLVGHTPQAEHDPRLLSLLVALSTPVELQGLRLQVSGSIGVVSCSVDRDEDADHLVRLADHAMYQAKQQGRNRYHLFDRELSVVEQDAHDTRRRMAEGLKRGEFVLFYQPKVHLRTGQVIGLEALIRWQHPERGLLAPGAFMGYVVGYDIDIDVGRWVIQQALRQMKQWHLLGIHLPVSVNVSGDHLQSPSFLDELHAMLISHPELPAGSLELEVLESSALADVSLVSEVIRRCAGMGVTVALDDFGTGYSSLSYLKQLPAQTLKIDQSFVRSMLTDRGDLSILQGVLGLAEAFDRRTVAEGVETTMHGLMLLQLGCQWGQGYGIARPMPAQEIPLWIDQWQTPAPWAQARARDGLSLDLLVASVHWCEWMRQLLAFLDGAEADPPLMDDPVSPMVDAVRHCHEAGLPEGQLRPLSVQVVALAHRAVAMKMAGQTAMLMLCLQELQTLHNQMHRQMIELGYWV